MAVERVVVIGLGLIGGSIAKALQPHYEVWAFDSDPVVVHQAKADGFAVGATLTDAITMGSLVVVATPVDAIDATFAELADVCDALGDRRGVLITDVCSVKASVVGNASQWGLRFIGGHPMAGNEHHGYRAATDSLFSGARWALALSDDTDLDDWFAVAALVAQMGATATPVGADAHDRAVAAISHLPHVLASGLASVTNGPDGDLMIGLAAGSFRDGTRVARSSPQFWASVLGDNGVNMIPLLRSMSEQFASLAAELASGDATAVREYFLLGERERIRYENRTAVSHTIACADDADALDALFDIGARGGSVTGHEIVAREPAGTQRRIHVRVPLPDTGAA